MQIAGYFGIVLALLASRPVGADSAQPVSWRASADGRARVEAAKLVLTPADAPWDRTSAVAPDPITFWNAQGAVLHLRMSLQTLAEGSSRDAVAFIGFTTSSKADSYQSAENVVGLSLDFSRKTHLIYVSTVRKEKNGDAEAARGDEWGNLAPYAATPTEIPLSNAPLDITLTVNRDTVSARIAGTSFSQSFPAHLTPAFWKNCFPLAQCMNNNDGRGAITLDSAVITALEPAPGDRAELDFKRRPPDMNTVPDQVTLRALKRLGVNAFSVAGSSDVGGGGTSLLAQDGYARLIRSFGGISRFPYGLGISYYFWPYEARDWLPALGKKGGTYGTIERWYYPNSYKEPEKTLSYQTMLAAYKRLGLKLILLFNVHAMFDGHDFVYVKTLPEEQMKSSNPLVDGQFSSDNLHRIVVNNATLVDYIVKHGYTDTVACWEMDNERWDMPGKEYAACVAAHVKMLRQKLPKAKVIVCLGDLGSYSRSPERDHYIAWSRDVLTGLRDAGLANQIDYFAPHLYPYLFDRADEIVTNQLEDWNVRNCYRSLDYLSTLLDRYNFLKAKFYVSEWGSQSDGLEDHNERITTMAAAIATVKEMMAIYSHPRVEGSTWHQFFHASYVSKAKQMPFSQWGEQTVYITDTDRIVLTPPSEAVQMFVAFARNTTLIPSQVDVPAGVHYLCADDTRGKRYFVINSTNRPVAFRATGVTRRTTLSAESPTANTILIYGKYGDTPGEINPIVPRDYQDMILPPYSVNIVR
jgi:hypothetical protein